MYISICCDYRNRCRLLGRKPRSYSAADMCTANVEMDGKLLDAGESVPAVTQCHLPLLRIAVGWGRIGIVLNI